VKWNLCFTLDWLPSKPSEGNRRINGTTARLTTAGVVATNNTNLLTFGFKKALYIWHPLIANTCVRNKELVAQELIQALIQDG
jgi:hypothetical protein